jgi:glycosyltransferase involved in cell wall biosynthesis
LREELADSTLRAEIIEIQKNQGKAFAISRGILKLNSSHFAILDADLEIKPSEVLRMWKEISQNSFDAVFAYRTFHSHSSFTYRYTIGNKFISHWYGLWFNQVVTDIMCGLKMVPSAPFKTNRLKFRRFALEVEIPMVLWAHKIKVKEIEIEYHPRGWDEGKTIGLRDAMYVLLSIAFGKYYYFFRMRKMV